MASAETSSPLLIDLFGLLACVRLTAFERRAADAGRAGAYEDRVVLGGLAVAAFTQFERVRDRIIGLGADPRAVMRPFQPAIDGFHDRTRPADAMEALTKVYVADALLADLYIEGVGSADAAAKDAVRGALADSGHVAPLTERLRTAAEADPLLASRLGLWARRLAGEALCEAESLAGRRATLAALFGDEGVAAVFGRVADRHRARMRAIGLRD